LKIRSNEHIAKKQHQTGGGEKLVRREKAKNERNRVTLVTLTLVRGNTCPNQKRCQKVRAKEKRAENGGWGVKVLKRESDVLKLDRVNQRG